MRERKTDVLIVGASLGGVSAAISCAKMGVRVILTEETEWIGGQATTQGVPLDEHPWIEKYGRNQSYADFRQGIRDYYKRNYPLTYKSYKEPNFNPGACWVSRLGFEPRVGIAVLNEMMAPYLTNGQIEIWTKCVPVSAEMDGDKCRLVVIEDINSGDRTNVSATYFLDGTELGDLLPLANVEHVIGAEAQKQTGEPLALEGDADPTLQQPFTQVVCTDYLPGENHVIERPAGYEYWRNHFTYFKGHKYPEDTGKSNMNRFFNVDDTENYIPSMWNFRRSFCKSNFIEEYFPSDVTMIMNGTQYKEGVLLGVSEEEKTKHLNRAREQALCLIYFLQTEIEDGYEGKNGFPGLRPRGDMFGTKDGLAQYPYIRESRRIKAEFTVLEQHFRIDLNPNCPVKYHDSVGLGGYRIDIHLKSQSKDKSITMDSHGKHWVQQIPLGSLIPVRVENILPCCKNLGTTHITNGAFRLHPVEWNIGEAAGFLAGYCINKQIKPREVRNIKENLSDFQRMIVKNGVELEWPEISFGRSYYSHFVNQPDWYFGETKRL